MNKIIIANVEVLIEKNEKYMQINDIHDIDIWKLWKQIKAHYDEYDVVFCFHNTEVPLKSLDKIGAVILDDSLEMFLTSKCLSTPTEQNISCITEKDFDCFATLHDECNLDMYWTSRRIKDDLSIWDIRITQDDKKPIGYIMTAMWHPDLAEIFCVVAVDMTQGMALITAAVLHAFETGKTKVLFMADADTMEQRAAIEIGFNITGYYKSYIIKQQGDSR